MFLFCHIPFRYKDPNYLHRLPGMEALHSTQNPQPHTQRVKKNKKKQNFVIRAQRKPIT